MTSDICRGQFGIFEDLGRLSLDQLVVHRANGLGDGIFSDQYLGLSSDHYFRPLESGIKKLALVIKASFCLQFLGSGDGRVNAGYDTGG